MTIQTRTTELEAVNTILSTIGEAPLNSLTGSLPVDGTMAQNIIDEINTNIYKQFNEENIVIPYPQRDIHVISSDGPL